jgi:hypothetical protein
MNPNAANNDPAPDVDLVDRAAREVTTSEDLYRKILNFLICELAREEKRRCIGIDLFYAPGGGFRDEIIRKWTREDDSELFEHGNAVETLASQILEIAEGEADARPAGKHRFIVRTYQHYGARQIMSFSLSPMYFGDDGESGKEKKSENVPDVDRKNDGQHEPRKRLLARMAGNIAAGVITQWNYTRDSPRPPSKSMTSAEAIATISVDVAEAILKKIGL